MPYTITSVSVAIGDTVLAAHHNNQHNDLVALGSRYVDKDGSVGATGTFTFQTIAPSAPNTYICGSTANYWSQIAAANYYVAATQIIDSSRNLINLAGISVDATVRKVVVDIGGTHKYLFHPGVFTWTNVPNTNTSQTFVLGTTLPGSNHRLRVTPVMAFTPSVADGWYFVFYGFTTTQFQVLGKNTDGNVGTVEFHVHTASNQ